MANSMISEPFAADVNHDEATAETLLAPKDCRSWFGTEPNTALENVAQIEAEDDGDQILHTLSEISRSPLFCLLLEDYKNSANKDKSNTDDFRLRLLAARLYMAGKLSVTRNEQSAS